MNQGSETKASEVEKENVFSHVGNIYGNAQDLSMAEENYQKST